jgi:hypothetical protein
MKMVIRDRAYLIKAISHKESANLLCSKCLNVVKEWKGLNRNKLLEWKDLSRNEWNAHNHKEPNLVQVHREVEGTRVEEIMVAAADLAEVNNKY